MPPARLPFADPLALDPLSPLPACPADETPDGVQPRRGAEAPSLGEHSEETRAYGGRDAAART